MDELFALPAVPPSEIDSGRPDALPEARGALQIVDVDASGLGRSEDAVDMEDWCERRVAHLVDLVRCDGQMFRFLR